MKTNGEFEQKRKDLVKRLEEYGYLKELKVKKAMLKVAREDFVLPEYRNSAYEDTPLPIPAEATISAPHMHAMYLSAADLKPGDKVLEIGAGSGILLVYAKEIVGPKGVVVGTEINPVVYRFAKNNLEKSGYDKKVKLILTDGTLGTKDKFDKIFVSATAPDVPKELVDQLRPDGLMLVPVGEQYGNQELLLIHKNKQGKIMMKSLGPVIFVPMRGKGGF